MKPSRSLTVPVVMVLLLSSSGCVGTGPNTQQGAVGGAAVGAIAGGIIGNNSRGGNALGGAVIGGVVGAIAGGTLGNSIDNQRGTLYRSEAEATSTVVMEAPPPLPPPQVEVVTVRPSAMALWIEGCWVFDGYRYAWMPGYWAVPPPHCRHYVHPHWARHGGGYVYVRGYWH